MKFIFFMCFIYFTKAETNFKSIIKNIVAKSQSGVLPEALSDPHDDDKKESENLDALVETMRRMAAVGIGDVPVFEPYISRNLYITVNKTKAKGECKATDIVVRGLSKYAFDNFLLQSQNVSVDNAKLLKFKQYFRKLDFNANLIGEVWQGTDKEPNIITAKLSAVAKDVVNNGTLGIEQVVALNQTVPGNLRYAVTAFKVETRISELKWHLGNIKTSKGWLPSKKDLEAVLREVADDISLQVMLSVKKQIDVILNGITPEQVDAFLLPFPLNH